MNIVVDSLLTNYERNGKGKTVVLLHGWGDSAQTFQQLSQPLSKSYEVITIDLPGFGHTQPPEETWGLDDYATFVGHFITKLGVNPYAVVGHSNGGAIAIRGLASQMLSAEKLVLLASAGIRSEYKGRKHLLRLAAKTAKLATKPLPNRLQQRIKKRAYAAVGSDLFVAEHLQETFKRVVTDDVLGDAKTLDMPTLIIYGDQDTATPVRYGERFHESIKGSKLVVLEGGGHFVHHDKPQQVIQSVEEFLNA